MLEVKSNECVSAGYQAPQLDTEDTPQRSMPTYIVIEFRRSHLIGEVGAIDKNPLSKKPVIHIFLGADVNRIRKEDFVRRFVPV